LKLFTSWPTTYLPGYPTHVRLSTYYDFGTLRLHTRHAGVDYPTTTPWYSHFSDPTYARLVHVTWHDGTPYTGLWRTWTLHTLTTNATLHTYSPQRRLAPYTDYDYPLLYWDYFYTPTFTHYLGLRTTHFTTPKQAYTDVRTHVSGFTTLPRTPTPPLGRTATHAGTNTTTNYGHTHDYTLTVPTLTELFTWHPTGTSPTEHRTKTYRHTTCTHGGPTHTPF